MDGGQSDFGDCFWVFYLAGIIRGIWYLCLTRRLRINVFIRFAFICPNEMKEECFYSHHSMHGIDDNDYLHTNQPFPPALHAEVGIKLRINITNSVWYEI